MPFVPWKDVPDSFRAPDNDVPVEDQGQIGSCVGEAEGGEQDYRELRDTGKVTRAKKLRLYRDCKKLDGSPDTEGTFPGLAAKIKTTTGVPTGTDDRTLTHQQIVALPDMSPAQLEEAGLHVAKGYASPAIALPDIIQAVWQLHTMPVTVEVGNWSRMPVKPSPSRGYHRIRLNGFDITERDEDGVPTAARIWFRNSWGSNWCKAKGSEERKAQEYGNAYFLWEDYRLHIFEPIAYADIPTHLIEEARAKNYVFTRTLKPGSRGPDVQELQKRLAKEPALDGQPCYRYQENGTPYFSQYYGSETRKAVERYQAAKGIMTHGTPETTGYGQLGPSTRDSLNGVERKQLYPAVIRRKDQLIRIMAAVGQPIVITGDYRTAAEQDALYAQGRTAPGKIVTNAKGGDSMHNWRCAFDIAFSTSKGVSYDGPWAMVGEIGRTLGLEWGGDWADFPDKPHFQYTAGYSLDDFKAGKVDETKLS